MNLEEIEFSKNQIAILNKRGIQSVEDMLHKAPLKYYDFTQIQPLTVDNSYLMDLVQEKIPVSIVGHVYSVKRDYDKNRKGSKTIITIKMQDDFTNTLLHVTFMGAWERWSEFQSYINSRIIVGGILDYNDSYHSFSMLNPVIFTDKIEQNMKIHTVYSSIKGIDPKCYSDKIQQALNLKGSLDFIPGEVLAKYKLPSFKSAAIMLHNPKTMNEITLAKKRFVFDDLVYFSCKLEEQEKNLLRESRFILKKRTLMDQFITSRPFSLTKDQNAAINAFYKKAVSGRSIKALVQGDVGCGKTIVAFALMILCAENGYQAVLMAPTLILARQHYEEFEKISKELGYRTAFLGSNVKQSERKKIIAEINAGKYDFIIGTNSVVGTSIDYPRLGLMITDEEHKFGVVQREALVNKQKDGCHNIIMSATPIPRTLASTLYGEAVEVYSIKTMPAGREPIQTAICKNNKTIFAFMEKEILKGRQCYVVCPVITQSNEKGSMTGTTSIKECEPIYREYFEKRGIQVGVVTGKTPKAEMVDTIDKFMQGTIQILMATQVIEVGTNNPNASCIVITGAERFGLAAMHQLRGRVGRGHYKSYCILQKSPSASETSGLNLQILCEETDGLKIATEDLKNRGAGSLIGTRQAGNDKYINLMLQYPNMYKVIRELSKKLCKDSTGKEIIKMYEDLYLAEED